MALSLFILFFYMMAPFLIPILLGAVLAILTHPIYDKLRVKIPKSLSAFLVTIGLTLGIILPLCFVVYTASHFIVQQVGRFRLMKGESAMNPLSSLHPLVEALIAGIRKLIPMDSEWIRTQSLEILEALAGKLSVAAGAAIGGMPSLLLSFSVVILSFYFFLMDGPKFLKFLVGLSPLNLERTFQLYDSFEQSCRGVVLSLMVSASIQGLLMTLIFLIVGLPNALLVGLVTVVAGMIPVVGSAPIWMAATVYLFLLGNVGLGIVMLVGGILISTSDNIVRPLIMKEHSEMHPLLALVSVFGALNLVGAMGIFLGPIIAAVFVAFLKILTLEVRKENTLASNAG